MRARVLRFRCSLESLPPEEVALLLSVGLLLGVFPMVVVPTVLCLLAAAGLRLNAIALQMLNSLSSPLQLALLIPLERVGAWLCGGAAPAQVSLSNRILSAGQHAVAGWFFVCVPAAVLLYFTLLFALTRWRFNRMTAA